MRKLLLALVLSPLALAAQNASVPLKNASVDKPIKVNPLQSLDKVNVGSPVRINNDNPIPQSKPKMMKRYALAATQTGATTYDLQTNGSMPRRLLLYPNGEMSLVWTMSKEDVDVFSDRGTAYSHYTPANGWSSQNENRFEHERAGWPNIVPIMENNTQKEMIVSHYASGGDNLAGGLFWMKNSGVGNNNFDVVDTVDKPNGPLWPRAASTGNLIHVVAVYGSDLTKPNPTKINGIYNPVVYYRYNVDSNKFEVEKQLLPGYTSDRYGQGSADQYSIDARDSVVAILMGGSLNDLALWKSTDYGHNWTKTIIDTFAPAPYNSLDDKTFDTAWSNDGSVNVLLDPAGVAHVFYPRMRVLNEEEGDDKYSYFPGTNGIVYWNDKKQVKTIVAGTPDIDGDQTLNILAGTTDTKAAGYSHALATYPMSTIDDKGNIFLVYSAPNETDVTFDNTSNFRDLFVTYSTDGGDSWGPMQTLTNDEAQLEDVFATIPANIKDKMPMSWMRDNDPGIFLVNEGTVVLNRMMYATVSTADIMDDVIGLFDATTGIQKLENNLFKVGDAYPNPASSFVNIPVSLNRTASINVKVIDVLGKVVNEGNYDNLTAGNTVITMDLSTLSKGVYTCQINAGGFTTTQKLIVE